MHWITVTFREECDCGLGADHDENEYRAYLDEVEREAAMRLEREGDGGTV